MVIAIAPLVIAIGGLLLWLLTTKASEVGRILFACGTLVLTMTLAKETFHLGSMAVAIAPLVIAVVGLLMWFLASNPRASEIGRILFCCGALVLTMSLAKETFRVGVLNPAPAPISQAA